MASNERIRVLIADDHAVLRTGLRRLLGAQPDMLVVGEADPLPESSRAGGMKPIVQPDWR